MRKTGGTREWKAGNGPMHGMCVILAHRALDLEERQTNARLPRLGLLQDEVVHGLAQGGVGAVVGICGGIVCKEQCRVSSRVVIRSCV